MKNIRAKLVSLNTRESLSEFEICIGVYVLSLVPPFSSSQFSGRQWRKSLGGESERRTRLFTGFI